MALGTRRAAATGLAVLVLLTTAACSDAGDLEIANDGPEDVVVRTGDEGVDLSLTRPFDIPAEFTVSVRGVSNERESWRLQDARAMIKLVKVGW